MFYRKLLWHSFLIPTLMPFVERNSSGAIIAIFATPRLSANEWRDAGDLQIHEFLAGLPASERAPGFDGLDIEFIRVLEDVIDTLIAKNVLRLTDLPHEAQRKLLARKGLRGRLRDGLDLLSGDDVI